MDKVKEKLIFMLLDDEGEPLYHSKESVGCFAEYLIANGVTVQEWISVKDRLPEEHDSIFAGRYGTEGWLPGMFRTISDKVIAIVVLEGGTRIVRERHTADGKWNLNGIFGAQEVTHWMPMPLPPKGE